MRSLRFLVSRRWLLFLLVVLLLAYLCLILGRWQWHRLTARKAGNAIIRTNEAAAPTPVDQVLRRGANPPDTDSYKVVSATGTYDPTKTVIVRYQTNDEGQPGADAVVPLMTSSGTALLVDRGWFSTSNQGSIDAAEVPAPPSGTVTVTGYVRQDAGGGSTQVVDASTRSISSAAIQPAVGVPVYGGWVDLKSESPAASVPLEPAGLPDLSNGPHFFYALQWWFFGILALFGFGYLAWEEATGRADLRRAQQPAKKAASSPQPAAAGATLSEGAGHPAVDGQHGAADEGRRGAEQERRGPAEL
ncbi:MAG: SURF1 family protein [Nocardioides sp.]